MACPLRVYSQEKIEVAAVMLLENKMNITETSYYLNFDNPLYFSNRFKKHMGISPLQWKKRQSER